MDTNGVTFEYIIIFYRWIAHSKTWEHVAKKK